MWSVGGPLCGTPQPVDEALTGCPLPATATLLSPVLRACSRATVGRHISSTAVGCVDWVRGPGPRRFVSASANEVTLWSAGQPWEPLGTTNPPKGVRSSVCFVACVVCVRELQRLFLCGIYVPERVSVSICFVMMPLCAV